MSSDEQQSRHRRFKLELVRSAEADAACPPIAYARAEQARQHTLHLIGSIATAYDRLTPEAAQAVRRVFAGSTLLEAHQAAELVLMSTPMRDLTMVMTRLMAMSAESELDVLAPEPDTSMDGGKNPGSSSGRNSTDG